MTVRNPDSFTPVMRFDATLDKTTPHGFINYLIKKRRLGGEKIARKTISQQTTQQQSESIFRNMNIRFQQELSRLKQVTKDFFNTLAGKLMQSGLPRAFVVDAERMQAALEQYFGEDGFRAYQELEELFKANKKFNNEIERYNNGIMKANEMFHLGDPIGVLKAFLENIPIVMRQRVLAKGVQKKHNIDINELRNLPHAISNPIFVFKKTGNTIGLLTEIKDKDGKNVFVSIDMNKTIQDGKEFLEVNDITSLHGRDAINIVLPIIENKTLQYVSKEKGLAYLTSALNNIGQAQDKSNLDNPLNYLSPLAPIASATNNPEIDPASKIVDNQQQYNSAGVANLNLEDAAKIINNFQNPNINESFLRMMNTINETQADLSKVESVSNFIKDVLDDKITDGKRFIVLPDFVNKRAEQAIGHTIKSHSIRADEIRHINKKHGINGTKNTDQSIPLRKEDIALMPYIMAAPDRVEKGTLKADGTESVRYIKELSNGQVVVVEQEGKFDTGDMTTITMWAENKKSHSPYVYDARTNARPHTSTSQTATTTKTATATVIISPNDIAKIRNDFEKIKQNAEKLLPRLMTTPNGEVYGFVAPDGTVYIDPNKINANTPIHEVSHLWNDYIKANHPELWNRGKELIKNSPYWNAVNANPAYQNLSEEQKADEALAMAIGDRGEQIVHEKGLFQQLQNWISELWQWLGSQFGIRGLTSEQIQNLTLQQFVDGAVADLLSGNPIAQLANQTNYDFDVSGITEANAQEMQRIKTATTANGTFMKAPNGKQSNLNERQWLQVRTESFKRWFGDWEAAAIINIAEGVWNGSMTAARINFALSEKTQDELKKLLGKDFQLGFLTDSDIRHTKNHHGQNEESRGQVNITPEDFALVPYVMNEFDRVTHTSTDKLGNRKVEFTKRINGTVYVASIERGKNKEQLITMWKKPVQVADAKSPGPTSETTPNGMANIQQISETLRTSAKNSSKVVDENGEPMPVYHGTPNEFTEFDISKLGSTSGDKGLFGVGFYFNPSREYVKLFAYSNDANTGYIIESYLNLKNPFNVQSSNIDELLDLFELNDGGLRENGLSYNAIKGFDTHTLVKMLSAGREKLFTENLINLGYDGVISIDRHNEPSQYVAFNPNQIKSATDNNGNFDNASNDIRFQFVGEQGAAALDKAEEATTRMDNLSVARQMEQSFAESENEEVQQMKQRISDWLTPENLEWAKGKTLEEVIEKFGNDLESVAYLNPVYLQYLGDNINDNRVYSGKGYFVDHAANHHPEISVDEYGKIQEILNNPDEIKLDKRTHGRASLIFIKQYDKYFAEVINIDKDGSGKIVFHKTLYYANKTPQKGLPNVEVIASLVDGLPTISPANAAAVLRNISALNDGTNIRNFLIPNNISVENQKKIKLATGWERTADGFWKYEINAFDSTKKFTDAGLSVFETGETEVIALGDAIKSELFDAYPQLKGMPVYIIPVIENRQKATFDGEKIEVQADLAAMGNRAAIESYLAHEIQHAIQNIEGFARGGNIASQAGRKTDLWYDVQNLYQLMQDTPEFWQNRRLLNETKDALDDNAKLSELLVKSEELQKAEGMKAIEAEKNRLTEKYGKDRAVLRVIDHPTNDFDPLWNDIADDMHREDKYRRLAGEVEARNVQTRLNMSPQERQASLASETEDVARKDQIFIYDAFNGAQAYLDSQNARNTPQNLENTENSGIFAQQNIKNNAERIEAGEIIYKRFSQREQRGLIEGGRANVEASLIAGREVGTRESQDERADRIEEEVERYAKDAGIWHDNTEEYLTNLYGNPINSGQESLVFDKKETVVKTSNILQYRDLQDALDGVTLHNTYFPASTRQVIGFGMDEEDGFQIISEQPYIVEGERQATQEEIDEFAGQLGFEKSDKYGLPGRYINRKEGVIMNDLKPKNVIRTTEGIIIPIDPILHLNTPVWEEGGTRGANNTVSPTESQPSQQSPQPETQYLHHGYGAQNAVRMFSAQIAYNELAQSLGPQNVTLNDDGTLEIRHVDKNKLQIVDSAGETVEVDKQEIREQLNQGLYSELARKYENFDSFLLSILADDEIAINNNQVLVESAIKEESNNRLRVIDILKSMGVHVMGMTEYMDKYELKNGHTPTAKALADIANRIIAIADDASMQDFMEEAAHFLIEAYADQDAVNRILESDDIKQTEEWQQYSAAYYQIYGQEYEGEALDNAVKREILGKILTRQIIENAGRNEHGVAASLQAKPSIYSRIRDFFHAIVEWIKANVNVKAHKSELDLLVNDISNSLFSSDAVDFKEAMLDKSNLGVMYSLGDHRVAKQIVDRKQEHYKNLNNLRKLDNRATEQANKLKGDIEKLRKEIDGMIESEYDAVNSAHLHEVINGLDYKTSNTFMSFRTHLHEVINSRLTHNLVVGVFNNIIINYIKNAVCVF